MDVIASLWKSGLPYVAPVMSMVVVATLITASTTDIGYGRYTNVKNITIPSCFGWVIMEAPAVLSFWFVFAQFMPDFSWFLFFENLITSYVKNSTSLETAFVQIAGLCLFSLHYIFRAFIYPFLGNNPFRPMELKIALSGTFFCLLNGSGLAYELANGTEKTLQHMPSFIKSIFIHTLHLGFEPGAGQNEYTLDSIISSLLTPRMLVRVFGVIVFFYGWGINQQSDSILRSLRKNDSKNERKYKIPRGGLFQYVSCANYFGEILEWFGFFLALQTYTSFLFLLGTMANLVPRALKYHQGYIKKMDNYPKNRKAVFPYIL